MQESIEQFMPEVVESLTSHGYDMGDCLGTGSYSVVHKVSNLRFQNQEFVVKILLNSADGSRDTLEFETLLNLTHPHILNLYARWTTANCLLIVLEYAPGGSLSAILKNNGPLTPPTFRAIARQTLEALAYCHECNFFHGDIKPANILLDAHGGVKLADFGLAGRLSSTDRLPIQGSLPYMSPELVIGRSKDGFANDIWALGITFLELATGRRPWRAREKSALIGEIAQGVIAFPAHLDRKLFIAVRRMLSVVVGERATADQLLAMPAFQVNPEPRRLSFSGLPPLRTPTAPSPPMPFPAQRKVGPASSIILPNPARARVVGRRQSLTGREPFPVNLEGREDIPQNETET
jgi:serine/threonine protein kinase